MVLKTQEKSMKDKSDPLQVLLDMKAQLKLTVDDELIKKCYDLQKKHQYDKDRDTMNQMQAIIEEAIKDEDKRNNH